ncbi:peptide chain release factor N(5)-glutamine methyltransferase [Bacillus sp. 28A-2]|uniref:peptide chain release factor N(5)-glutamine methyltransferase n=1 Tax=Bacillus sp. 28A-2 TaxID=2772252 RepID=UPI00168D6BFB|nr:peptide chain release factor N(5)-glutamine methyltransferase [Bacillus sp. 28A-2]MBD3859118.1 peptide chain release factor N(5)-glutamine methyltransferase [Bacillus sp. 28A-2]
MQNNPRTIFEALKWASSLLTEAGRDQNAAELLLMHVLGWSRSELLARFHEPLKVEKDRLFSEFVTQHKTGVPVQHLTGIEFFYGRPFEVNKHVLIPRPETEEVVLAALNMAGDVFPHDQPLKAVDVGTGSGAIAITLALEKKFLSVTATDISRDALAVAKRNQQALGADVHFLHGDLLEPVMAQGMTVDVFISNPPYIAAEEMDSLSEVVTKHEPVHALTDGRDGLWFYKRLVRDLHHVLNEQAVVVFEIGHTQAQDVKALLMQAFPKADVRIVKDINGKDRAVCAHIQNEKSG